MKQLALLTLLLFGFSAAAQTPKANKPKPAPPSLPPLNHALEDAFGGLGFSMPVAVVSAPGEKNRVFVLEKTGTIQMVVGFDQPKPEKRIFADLRERSDGIFEDKGECGLLGLAFHPNFANNGFCYVAYSLRIDGQLHQRISRLNFALPEVFVEQPLITQPDPAGNHNGGDLHFGPDGYLYASVGDGGGANDAFDNGRFIHKDFHAAILRIDVDQKPGNLPPNPHPAVHAGTYAVPADNPFVRATSHHGEKLDPATVRTEIWATGLRNVWRFSFDPPTGRLFAADVGQNLYEEVNLIEKGGDYGWSHREGFHAFDLGPGKDVPPADFHPVDPIFEYPRSTGLSITGGAVYRGPKFPEFSGAYFCADYVFGRVIVLREKNGKWEHEIIAFEPAITGIGVDPRDGELLFCNMAKGRIMRLAGTGRQP